MGTHICKYMLILTIQLAILSHALHYLICRPGREEMKLNAVNYTSPSHNVNSNTEYNRSSSKKKPSFGNLGVGLASFIENNGFLGEFLTIDTVGMMAPRTIQGYTRNREDLGHLNYKAGREEMVRELLSGPAFFYVPLMVLTLAGVLRGKSAKVEKKVLDVFKNVMKNEKTQVDLKNAAATKESFIKTVITDAFKDYKKETGIIEQISDLMNRNVTEKLSLKDKFANLFKNKSDKKTTPAMLRKEAEELVTKLNKANGRLLDNAGAVELSVVDKSGNVVREQFGIVNLFKDMSNYLDDFTAKAQKAANTKDIDTETFIDKFHKKAKELRNLTNILAVSALSAFLVVIPKIYQTGKSFPGKDGLTTGEAPAANNEQQAQSPADEATEKEGV